MENLLRIKSLFDRIDKHMTLTESQKHLTSLIETGTPYPHKDDLFNLDDMPMELLDAAWHRYHPYTMTKNHRNKLSSIRKIAESQTDYKQQIEETQKAITETYKIPVEHFLIVNGEHGLYAAILVALTDDNVDIIEKEMESQGFFRAQPTDNQILEDRKNRKWIDIRFEPTEPDDVTFEIKTKYNVLFHLVPSVFSRKVETEGIKTSNRNPLFRYSEDRAFLIEGDATMEEIQELVNSLYAQAIMKGYKNLTPDYTLFTIDLNSIPNSTRFYYDINEPKGLYTKQPISPSCIIDKKDIKART